MKEECAPFSVSFRGCEMRPHHFGARESDDPYPPCFGTAGDKKTMAKKNKYALITRLGLSFQEKFVHVTYNNKNYRMDPQWWVFKTTGKEIDREGCIVNYADGMTAAGYEVFIMNAFLDRPAKMFGKFESNKLIKENPTYFLIGFLSGKEWWYKFLAALPETLDGTARLELMQKLGAYYKANPSAPFTVTIP
jgi:hypothetical protein